ncbi:hypothetical protein NBRC116598_28280 [Pseudophaeobacter arcticus]|uniref:Uncharacterized protein n=1 Tax=Pseudophaeobacter arcticus TaxID=385492 RepID=A0ABQ0ANH9_9RHOB
MPTDQVPFLQFALAHTKCHLRDCRAASLSPVFRSLRGVWLPPPSPGVRITRPGWRSHLLAVCVRVCLRRTVVHIVQIRPIDR